jgi:energy-coupling factor transporter ATP-binding protein EcfA2
MLNSKIFTDKDLKFHLPFSMMVSGPSGAGKSTFLLKLLSQARHLIEPPPKSILYAYGQMTPDIPLLQRAGVSVYAGVPPDDVLRRQTPPLLLILDDLILEIDEQNLSSLFMKKSHHMNMGVIFVSQNTFNKKLREARQNSQYLVLMRTPHSLSIRNLGTQLFPGQLDYFLQSYRSATSIPFSYLLLDLHPKSDPLLKLRTNIFDEEEGLTIFTPKNAI